MKIQYDAAARLAYDDWREQFNKGDFDEVRYQVFKTNYEAITVANVVAKKAAREEGSEVPGLMKLNEYGDCTEEEYEAAMSRPMSTGDVLGKALDAAQSQSEASSALKDAADALAEEEEVLAKKLGLDSVEELEVALDSMDGIAADGGELETENIARQARVREAYLEWCRKFDKEPDETRYPAFVENFFSMEEFAQETGKEMNLNEYADFTEEEFIAMQQGEAKVSDPSPATVAAAQSAPAPPVVQQPVEPQMSPEEMRQKRLEAEAKLRAEMEEAEKKRQEAKAAMIQEQEAARAKAAAEEEARRIEIEKEQKARQAEQEKIAAKLEQDAAAAAIAVAKAAAEKEAAQVAKRRADAEKAAELLRQQAKEWEAKQKKATATSAATLPSSFKAPELKLPKKVAPKIEAPPKVVVKAAPPMSRPTLNVAEAAAALLSITDKPAQPKASTAPKKAAPKAKKAAPSPFDFLLNAPEKKVAAAPVKKASVKKIAPMPAAKALATPAPGPGKTAPKSKPAGFFSFLAPPAEPAKPTVSAPAPVAPPAPAPVPAATKPEPVGLFSFFSQPAETTKKPTPAPAPQPMNPPVVKPSPKSEPGGLFGFFSATPAQPTQKKVAPAPPPAVTPPPKTVAPQSKPAAGLFPFFSAASETTKKETPAAEEPLPTVKLPSISSPPPSKPTFSFFGGSTAPAPKTKKAARKNPVKEVSDEPGTVALFFGKDNTVEKKIVEEPKRATTFSLFGGNQPVVESNTKDNSAPRPTLSLFGAGVPKKKADTTVPKGSASLSLKKAATPKKADTPVPKGSGTLSLFGGFQRSAPPAKKVAPAVKKAAPVAKKVSPKTAATKAKKATIPVGVPLLSRWKQNTDGSITGFISNSPSFRDNTKITTSPIKGNAAPGSLVQTGSGSKYYLN